MNTRADIDCCGPRGLGGWSPPDRPADTPVKRLADRIVPRNGAASLLFFAGVVALLVVAPTLPTRGELAVVAVAAALAGGWCAVNFWRCRHAHCVVSGAGWLALAAFILVEVVIGRSVIAGQEQLLFLGVLVASLVFEFGWYAARGTNAVVRQADERR